jgi:hypothetical protein
LEHSIIGSGLTRFTNYQDLKREALAFLHSHASEVLQLLIQDDPEVQNLDAVIRHLHTDGDFGDTTTIILYTLFLKIPIQVWHATEGKEYKLYGVPAPHHQDGQRVMELAYTQSGLPIFDSRFRCFATTGGHFDAIVPICDSGNGKLSARVRH